jgi:hypothetical protein
MPRSLIFLALVIFSTRLSGQIPNAGFENWDSVENYESPVGWMTNQSPEFMRLQKDTTRVEGQYSVKLFPSAYSWFDICESYLSIGIKMEEPFESEQSLYFFYKLIPDNSYGAVALNFHLRVFSNDGEVIYLDTVIKEVTPEFTEVEIPLVRTMVDSIAISITGGATSSGIDDGCYNRSIAWVDNLEIRQSSLTSSVQVNKEPLSVYPNPTRGIIQIDGDWSEFREYYIYSILGKLISQGTLTEPKIQINDPGFYILVLADPGNVHDPFVSKIIVHK